MSTHLPHGPTDPRVVALPVEVPLVLNERGDVAGIQPYRSSSYTNAAQLAVSDKSIDGTETDGEPLGGFVARQELPRGRVR